MPCDVLVQAELLGMTFPGRHEALRDVSFAVRSGEFVSIVGPSGCGKTTLLRLVAGLERPTTGTLKVAASPPGGKGTATRRVGLVFQDATLLPWRTVTDNIRLPMELEGIPRADQRRAVRDSLKLIGLTDTDAKKFPRMLSGGMRMRVSLARALINKPELLLLDEPFGALDEILRQQLNEELLRLRRDAGWTALFVTHNVTEAVFLSSRVLVMGSSPGTIAADITVPFDGPRSPELRSSPEFASLTGEISRQLRGAMA
jgi:NitT/TauT family transport system ATP-binding protein